MQFIRYCLSVLFFVPLLSYGETVKYCKTSPDVTPIENQLLQQLIPDFAKKMGCKIDHHCVLKWSIEPNSAKFSLAWKQQCGPVINGVYQLGDEGHGSTFVCQKNPTTGKTCCSPLGYNYVSKWVVCSY